MPAAEALAKHYATLSDTELLKLAAEGGLTADAEHVLQKELARRNLTLDDAKRHFAPQWLDEAQAGTIGVLTLESGERITAEVVGVNEQGDRLSIQVIPSAGFTRNGHPSRRSHRDIPFHTITSFEPQSHMMEQWPFTDPCRHKSSRSRLLLMSAIFVCMTAGSVPLFVVLVSRPYGLQEASVVGYTLFVLFFTFATTGSGPSGGNVPGYKFTCPAVEPQVPRLLWRHLIFLVALIVLESAMLSAHSHLRDWWNVPDRKGTTPFIGAFFLLCFALAWTQILTNKSLLNRAHRDFVPR